MRRPRLLLLFLVHALLAAAGPAWAQAPAPTPPRLESALRVSGITAVPGGHLEGAAALVRFAIYDVGAGGAPVWQEEQVLPLGARGEYAAVLGTAGGTGIPQDVFGTDGPRWLAVQVVAPGVPEATRARITSVPYSLRAVSAGNADTLGGLPPSAFLRAAGRSPAAGLTQYPGAGDVAVAPLVNSGTPGYLGKFTDAVDLGNSVLFENAGRVGLGTTTPLADLHVTGNNTGSTGVAVQNTGTSLSSASGYDFYSPQGALAASARFNNFSNILFLTNAAAGGAFDFVTGATSRLRIASDGKVGLGVAPSHKLDVVDDGTGVRVSGGHPLVQVEAAAPSAAAPSSQISLVRTLLPDNTSTTWTFLNNVTFSLSRDGATALSLDGNRTLTLATGTGDRLVAQGNIRVGTGTTGCVKDADGTVIAGTCSSDRRFKRDIAAFAPALDRLSQLTPVHYHWRADEFASQRFGTRQSWGLIAQDVAPLFPDLVTADEDGYLAVNYSKLPLYTVQAVKELKAESDRLRQQNDELTARLAALESLVRALRR